MDNKNNLNKNIKPGSKPMSLAEKLLAADQAKEDARNMYQQENAFKEQRAAFEKETLESYRNQGYVEAPKSSGTPISTRDKSARQMEQAKTKDGNANASNSTRQNFGRTVIKRNENHRSGTTQANVGANNNKPTNNTIQNNTNTKSNPQVSTPSRLHTASRTNVPPVSNESSKGGNFNARNEFTNRNLGESNQGARIPSPTYNAKNQANVNQTSSYTFNYNRGAFKDNKNFGGNENTVGGESGASYTPPVNRSTNIQPNHIESGSRSGSKENKGTRNGNAISRGNVASASAITGTSLYSNAVRVSNMSQSEKLQGADKARSDAQQMYQEEDRRRRMREAVEKSNLEKFEERLENHRSKNKISVDLNDVLPPRENRKVVSHYKSVRVEERPLAASKNDRMAPKTKAQHKEKEGAKTRQDVNAQASNKQANNNNKTVGNQGTKTGKIENTRQNTTIKTYKRTSYRMNQEEIKNIKDQIRGASKKSSKLTVKQALGKTMGATKSVGKAGKTAVIDAASAMNSDYAAAEFTKKQANRVGTKVAKAAGVGGVLSFAKGGVELLTSDDSAKTMTEVSTKIATKAIDKVIHVDRNLKKRAENEIKKQTKAVGKLDKKYDKLNSKELKLREKADKKYKKAKSKKNPKYKEKADKLTMKADKLRDKHAKANRKLGLKRNKETVRLNNLKAKARKKIARNKAAKKLALKFIPVIAIPVLLVVLISSVVGGSTSVGGYLITKFASDVVSTVTNFVSGEWTGCGKKIANLESINWAQFIADETAFYLGDTFIETAKKDAQSHYVDKKVTLAEVLEKTGDTSHQPYDWYCDIREGNIGHVWMREQCDNITDKDGKMIYDSKGNLESVDNENLLYVLDGKIDTMSKNYGYNMKYTYTSETNNRTIITPNANIVPILSMAHDRYTEEWTWENYEAVEAYVWYMYTLSHNAAHYDAGLNYNNNDAGTYSYSIIRPCDKNTINHEICKNGETYEKNFVLDSDGVLTKPKSTVCSNIYFHGYTTNTILNAKIENDIKSQAKSTSKRILSWIDAVLKSDFASAISETGTYIVSYERDTNSGEVADVDKNGKIYISGLNKDKPTDEEKYKQYSTFESTSIPMGMKTINEDGVEVYLGCNNLGGCKAPGGYVCGFNEEHDHKESNCKVSCSKGKQEHSHTKKCVPTNKNDCKFGKDTHKHSEKGGCYKDKAHTHKNECYEWRRSCNVPYKENEEHNCFIPNCKKNNSPTLKCNIIVHEHTKNCLTCKIEPHTHTTQCCKTEPHTHDDTCATYSCGKKEHKHKGWGGVSNPGCYNTLAYCRGHCGGHIEPSVNLAITYTMEGLAYQDAVALNAGTSKGNDSSWTGSADFTTLIGQLNDVTNLKEWSQITNQTCSKWFKAGPNGPLSAISYAGESIEKLQLKAFRGWRDFWQGLADKIFSNGNENDKPSYHDVPSDGDSISFIKEHIGEDDHEFNGWFEVEGKAMSFNKDLFDELHSLYGDPDDFYELGVEIWKSFDVEFNIGFGKILSKENISKITNEIKSKYFTDNESEQVKKRMDIITEALASCGMYIYDESSSAHKNGINSNSGFSDSIGFAIGIYTRTLGAEGKKIDEVISKTIEEYNKNPLEYTIPNGSNIFYNISVDSLQPGDIIIYPTFEVAAIYLGNYVDPLTGVSGYCIVECSDFYDNNESNHISQYKILTEVNALKSYPLVYREPSMQ